MAQDTTRPRASRNHNFADHGRPQSNNTDRMLLLPNKNCELWSPSWQNKLTTFRPLPARCGDDATQLTPYRVSPEPSAFGDWIRAYLVFKGGARQMTSFILYDQVAQPEYDLHDNPAHVLYSAIKGAVSAGQGHPSWAPMLEGSPGRGAPLAKPSTVYLMQGLLMEHDHKILNPPRGMGSNHGTVVLQVTGGAGYKMLEQLNQRAPQWEGDPRDYANSMLFGDAIAYDHGVFIRFCQAGGFLSQQQQQASSGGWAQGGGLAMPQGGGGGDALRGYDVQLTKTFGNFSSAIPPELRANLAERAKAWADIICIPTTEEQVLWLARAFPGDMINFAFQDHPEWLTADVLAITNNRATVPSAGMPAQQQQTAGGWGGVQMPAQQPGYMPVQQPGYMAPQQPGYMGQPQMGYPAAGYQQPGYPAQPGAYPGAPAQSGQMGLAPQGAQDVAAAAAATVPPNPAAPAQNPWAQAGMAQPLQSGFAQQGAGVPGVDPAVRTPPNAFPPFDPNPAGAPAAPAAAPGAPAQDPTAAALAAAHAMLGQAHVGQ